MHLELRTLKPIPAGENPYHHDFFHMGQGIGTDLELMFKNHSCEPCPYLILVDMETGTRVQILIHRKEEE